MPRVHFELETSLSPEAVVRALTDFSPHRAEVWRNIDAQHFQIHDQGPDWAEVTEGNALAGGIWERNRYQWAKEPGRVTITTLDSNVWTPGDGWDYRAAKSPVTGKTTVTVDVRHRAHSPKGVLIALVLRVAGARMLREDLRRVLSPLERS